METPNAQAEIASQNANIANGSNGNNNETKLLRIPLTLFTNKVHFEKLPVSVQKKATKTGIKIAGERKWGPEIPITAKEGAEIFKVAEGIYRSNDKSFGKHDKTFGYQLRNAVSELFDIKIENVRSYNRKPKVAHAPVQATEEVHMAASMPPRANLDRANTLLGNIINILHDNGQPGVAKLVGDAMAEITIPSE